MAQPLVRRAHREGELLLLPKPRGGACTLHSIHSFHPTSFVQVDAAMGRWLARGRAVEMSGVVIPEKTLAEREQLFLLARGGPLGSDIHDSLKPACTLLMEADGAHPRPEYVTDTSTQFIFLERRKGGELPRRELGDEWCTTELSATRSDCARVPEYLQQDRTPRQLTRCTGTLHRSCVQDFLTPRSNPLSYHQYELHVWSDRARRFQPDPDGAVLFHVLPKRDPVHSGKVWSPQEDAELRAAVEREGPACWQQKAEAFSTSRSGDSLRTRWQKVLAVQDLGEQPADLWNTQSSPAGASEPKLTLGEELQGSSDTPDTLLDTGAAAAAGESAVPRPAETITKDGAAKGAIQDLDEQLIPALVTGEALEAAKAAARGPIQLKCINTAQGLMLLGHNTFTPKMIHTAGGFEKESGWVIHKNPDWFVKVDGVTGGWTLSDELTPAGASEPKPDPDFESAFWTPEKDEKPQPWSPEEDAELRAVVEREGPAKWQQKAEVFSTSRSGDSLRNRWQKVLAVKEEKTQDAVQDPDEQRVDVWNTHKTALRQRWEVLSSKLDAGLESRSVQQPAYRRSLWSPNEDDLLRKAVKKHKRRMSDIPWASVAAMVSCRSPKQCRERWRNHIDPSISHAPWSEEENALLLRRYQDHDGKWCEISAALPGRPDEA